VYASIARSTALVFLGIAAAILASLVLARRMARPIQEIETRARELGEGQLDRRITLATGDALEGLANQFNRMAARVQETHAMQETRIAERTRDLAIANEAKSRFLAAATHDLRQPIHALALFLGQLRLLELPRDGPTLVDKAERSVEALRELLEACLDLSKLDVGAVTAEPKPLALHDLLSRLVAEFAPAAEAKGLALTLVPTSLWVCSDPVLLHRIVLNVLSNALQYTTEGRILIGCRRRGKDVRLIVADTGVGVDPAHLPSVFQEFYRAPEQRGKTPGLGLGLAIVKRLAALLGHTIDIESEPGKGTVFSISMARAKPQRDTPAPSTPLPESLRGIRVLVVDDATPARDAMQGLLAKWGCEVITAASGDDAIERARERCPDVVLCDLNLANAESGVDVLDRLQRACGHMLASAVVTGESEPNRLAEVRATGYPVALKPTTPAKLRALVEHLAQSRESSMNNSTGSQEQGLREREIRGTISSPIDYQH
jgi:signal transduction histidine kinase/CheY-like chemotaxis protein